MRKRRDPHAGVPQKLRQYRAKAATGLQSGPSRERRFRRYASGDRQFQRDDLARTQTEARKEEQNGIIAASSGCRSIGHRQYDFDTLNWPTLII
jgi:hypothetical protein